MPQCRLLLTIVSLALVTGCSPSTLDLRADLDRYRSSLREKLATNEALAKQFVACTARSQDGTTRLPPSGALGSVQTLIQRVRAQQPEQADALLPLQGMLSELVNSPDRRLSLSTIHHVVDTIHRWHADLESDEDTLSHDASRFTRLLLAYNKAYFGDLRFKANPAFSGSSLHTIVKVTSNGFVDRGGNAWLFPEISLDLSLADHTIHPPAMTVDSQRISADLTRIFLEAFFDTAFQVPAVHGATALGVEWSPQEQPYPAFDADHPPIPLEALARLTRDALRAEAAVTAAVGKLVRGGSVFGTQNETLAASLETAAGITVKKLVEHEGFCYFQVTQGARVARKGSITELEEPSSAHVTR